MTYPTLYYPFELSILDFVTFASLNMNLSSDICISLFMTSHWLTNDWVTFKGSGFYFNWLKPCKLSVLHSLNKLFHMFKWPTFMWLTKHRSKIFQGQTKQLTCFSKKLHPWSLKMGLACDVDVQNRFWLSSNVKTNFAFESEVFMVGDLLDQTLYTLFCRVFYVNLKEWAFI